MGATEGENVSNPLFIHKLDHHKIVKEPQLFLDMIRRMKED